MLVSIIIPVYNVEKYLKECLDSVLGQTYKNTEIIVVDDGSTDNSGLICDEYKVKYNNITVIHKKNEGLGLARNTGMQYMNGEFVFFIDSDDYIDKNLIEKLVIEVNNKKLDYIRSGYMRVNDNKKILLKRVYSDELFENNIRTSLLPKMIGSLPNKQDNIEMSVCFALYRTSIIKDYNLLFSSERNLISEDLIFNMEFMQKAKTGYISSICGYYYRYNQNSLTTKYNADRFEKVKILYLYVKNKLIEYKYDGDTFLRLSKNFFIYLRMCLRQEKMSISNKTRKEILTSIKLICNDPIVEEVVNDYPIYKLGIKQKLFLYLIRKKKAKCIHVLIELNKI